MKIATVYERYKHLDILLSDPLWLPKTFEGRILWEFWRAIKEHERPNTVSAHAPVVEYGGVDNDG